jgi:hypothetical protein
MPHTDVAGAAGKMIGIADAAPGFPADAIRPGVRRVPPGEFCTPVAGAEPRSTPEGRAEKAAEPLTTIVVKH